MIEDCVFCRITHRVDEPQTETLEYGDVWTIVPLNPVTPGHLLIVPKWHLEDFTTHPSASGVVMTVAAQIAQKMTPCNLITSAGSVATQSVFHLHLHLIPRRDNDGLKLPWSV